MITQRERANAPSLSSAKYAKNIKNHNIMFCCMRLVYILYFAFASDILRMGITASSPVLQTFVCEFIPTRDRRRDINRRKSEDRLTE